MVGTIPIPESRIQALRLVNAIMMHLLMWSVVTIKAYQSMDSSFVYTLFWIFLIPAVMDFLEWILKSTPPARPATEAPRAAAE